MLRKVIYQRRISRRDAGWKSAGDAGWKQFLPSIKPLFYALKTHLFVYFIYCGFATHSFMDFPIHLFTLKYHNSIHHSFTAGSNSSLRTRGHVGYWMEFHPTSLSEDIEKPYPCNVKRGPVGLVAPKTLRLNLVFFSSFQFHPLCVGLPEKCHQFDTAV